MHYHPAPPDDIVQAKLRSIGVGDPWLRQLPTHGGMRLGGQKAGAVTRVGNPDQLLPGREGAGQPCQSSQEMIRRNVNDFRRSVMRRPLRTARRVTLMTWGLRSTW